MRFIPALITGAAMGGFETTWSMSKRSEAEEAAPAMTLSSTPKRTTAAPGSICPLA